MFNFEQPLSKDVTVVPLAILNELKFRLVKAEQLLNILFIEETLAVLNEDKLTFVKDLHPSNIFAIEVTFSVLKLDKSKFEIEVKFNIIFAIDVVLEVSKLDKLKEVAELNLKFALLACENKNELSSGAKIGTSENKTRALPFLYAITL